MYKDWAKLAEDLSGTLRDVHKGIPDTMKHFSALARAATAEGALDVKTKELIALAIGIATRCDGCIAFHAKAAAKHGATREEILETLGMSVYMGGRAVLHVCRSGIGSIRAVQVGTGRRLIL